MDSNDPKKDKSSGISLEELPDENDCQAAAQDVQRRIEAFKYRKTFEKQAAQDIRRKTLENLSDEEKIRVMTQVYDFDRKEPRFELLLLYLLPLVFKYTDLFSRMMGALDKATEDFIFVILMIFKILTGLDVLFNYAELIVVFLLFFFPPFRSTRQRFLVSFDGLDVPQKLRLRPTDTHQRARVKWNQIKTVRKVQEVIPGIQLWGEHKQFLGVLRWDLWKRDKRVLLKLLKRFVGDRHPLRVFVEQELGPDE